MVLEDSQIEIHVLMRLRIRLLKVWLQPIAQVMYYAAVTVIENLCSCSVVCELEFESSFRELYA